MQPMLDSNIFIILQKKPGTSQPLVIPRFSHQSLLATDGHCDSGFDCLGYFM